MHLQPLDPGSRSSARTRSTARDAAKTTFKAGDLIKVTLRIRNTKERRYVAVTDPIPAGTEPVESWFATTAHALVEAQERDADGERLGAGGSAAASTTSSATTTA